MCGSAPPGCTAGDWGRRPVERGGRCSVHRELPRAAVERAVLADRADRRVEVLEIGLDLLQVVGPLVGRRLLLEERLEDGPDGGNVGELEADVLGTDPADQSL